LTTSVFNRRAITRLKAILIIDILIVAVAAGTYLYLTSQGVIAQGPKPAEFTLTDLIIDPPEAEVGESVSISLNVTNIGETDGNYTANLIINNSTKDNQTISLAASESSLVTFTDTENAEGNYTVQIGDLSGFFRMKPAPPTTSSIVLSKLLATPYESWVNDTVSITVIATNPSSSTDSLGVKLTINGNLTETKRIELDAGKTTTVEFRYNVTEEGTFIVKVNNMASGFIVVPTGMHNLLVVSSPRQAIDFRIDGMPFKTPHAELLTVGVPHTVAFPAADPTGRFGFLEWEDGSKNPSRTITLTERMTVKGYFSGGSSCPSLYIWNGTAYVYGSDISNHGWLGYINYINDDGTITYYRNNPWDYIPLDKSQLQPTDGNFNLTLIQKWNEIFYLDQAYMMVVDHPANVSVYSTMVEQYLDPNYMGNIYTVSDNPLTPISAVNEKGENVLPQISKIDGVFTSGTNGIQSPAWDNITWNRITLNLGNLSGSQQTKLVVRAIVDWGQPDDYTTWLDKFFAQPVPNGTQVTPPPYMEVKDANGNWVRVPESREFPLPPEGVARTYVVDLTGLFLTNDYSLRISNFWNVTFDYIGIDISPQQNITIQRIDPQAYLYQDFAAGTAAATGNFTKYGNVTRLVLNEDDMFVIGRQGDAVSLQFPIGNLTAPAAGMVRDYFFFEACWFKDENGNWGFGFGFTADPLPFRNMSGFPYPPTENYPSDLEHSAYLSEWNTRIVTPP
jgi:hypothetical protein